ncbi:hypothetical protein ACQX4I_10385 [Corynebacterium diphtheriae]|uniref:hypothetical protein n=1 Tax=Corynebacterium diphtheriae TaxID=1717 RepID=UPI0018C9AA85|nr:hypothetical protein [Corynebacterium diphtheriae]MBG9292152.1 hypothetical protein [Corynebacterium diphtheriae bv. gravis]MBG9373659.1 hypothetical protein [Corynebacterium diphtheriae bv. gravis]
MSPPGGRPLLTHRSMGTELTISAGNKHTGNPSQMANLNSARGSGTEHATAHQPELFTFSRRFSRRTRIRSGSSAMTFAGHGCTATESTGRTLSRMSFPAP